MAGPLLASRLTPAAGVHDYVSGLQIALGVGGAVHLFAAALVAAWLVSDAAPVRRPAGFGESE